MLHAHVQTANQALDSMLAQVAKTAFHSCLPQAVRLQEERILLAGRSGQQHRVLSKLIFLFSNCFHSTFRAIFDDEWVRQWDWLACNLNLRERKPLNFELSIVSHACYTRCCHFMRSLLIGPWRARLVALRV
jgi:hypothetical protein